MAQLPLNTLPAFRAVARRGQVRAAAEDLHLTHSAVSQQIRVLEQQLGVALFERRQQRVHLNAAGQALLQAVEPALDQLAQGMAAARAAAGLAAQMLRLSVVPSFAQRWLLPRMRRWRAQHPALVLELHASQQLVDLASGDYDAAIRQGVGPWRGMSAHRLFDSPLVALASPEVAEGLLAAGDGCLNALADAPLLGDAAIWARWFALAGLKHAPRPAASFNDAGLMLQAAEQGLGVALARDLLAADALLDGRLVQVSPLALPDESAQPLWLVHAPGREDDPAIHALARWLQAELAASQRQLGELTARRA